MNRTIRKRTASALRSGTVVLLGLVLGTQPAIATTYISVEPIPSGDVVGQQVLETILSAGYPNLEVWSNRLLNECMVVDSVADALASDGAISTINGGNTSVLVAAGGFEGITNPSYVFTVRDSGVDAASAADIDVLDNALGYVLNQGGTVHFSPDDPKAYDFHLDFAVVTFAGVLDGVDAKAFFDFLGTINADLWSGLFAGFTQIAFQDSPLNNSMLFLKPATSKQKLISGLSAAVSAKPEATYVTLNNNGRPTTDKAGISFPGNDWIAFPGGDQYLSKLGNPSPGVLSALAEMRLLHLEAVADLVAAIESGNVNSYLTSEFTCPSVPD
jgi:hypothetical protein